MTRLNLPTWKQYEAVYRKWSQFCHENNYDFWEPNVNHCILFLTELYEKCLSYSAINTSRSALSYLFSQTKGVVLGEDNLIVNVMKGVSKLRPSAPRYSTTWNPDTVLSFLKTIETEKCNLKQLSLKLVALLALSTGQRVQSLVSINILNIIWGNPVQIKLTKNLKTTSVTKSNLVLILPSFNDDNLCPVKTLTRYVELTKLLRNGNTELFIGLAKPHKPVGSQTVSRWLVDVLNLAGIDVTKFHAHSFRHASTSKAAQMGVKVDTILKRVGWTAESQVFAKFYDRPFENVSEFAEKILSIK